MAFDDSTRNRLQRFVSDARALLSEEFTRQMQHEYGMDPTSGEVANLDTLSHMDDTRRETARLLRDTLAHYLATTPSGGKQDALQRILREQAFTVLNRLAALRMMEARGFLIESIARGYQSKGYQLYQHLAGSALGETGDAYRCYLFSLFDEFALDLAVLFDRFSPQGRLFPREAALLALLNLINHPEIEPFWAADEAIGWIYQYYNSQEERRQMRADSRAPRNSRELAVRNQFFTPRYVVEFLTDNTLGRLWYEMTQSQTVLTDQCRYLVRRPNEIFLQSGEEAPVQEELQEERSQEELLQQRVYIPFRVLKDPRDITMLDPACGSMHFGLYAFDLFEVIYDEAWEIAHSSDEAQKSSASFAPFVAFVVPYPDKAAFLADVPRLIIEHNLHGIDIDPRAVQIAGLSLWLRTQRTWQQQGLRPQDRPRIRRSNIVCAEPMPGEEAFLEEFIEARLAAIPERKLLGQLVRRVFDAMKLAGEAGSLLKIEEEIASVVAEAKQQWLAGLTPEQGRLFAEDTAPPSQKERGLDVTGITDETFWERAEERIYAALQTYAEQAEHGGAYQRRLFADDAARGFAFIDMCRKRYDMVLMNPPFGDWPSQYKTESRKAYPLSYNDILAAFVERARRLLKPSGQLGAITSRTCFFLSSFAAWREEIILTQFTPRILADLGHGVMDSAMVEAAAYVLAYSHGVRESVTLDCFQQLTEADPSLALAKSIESINTGEPSKTFFSVDPLIFRRLPTAPLCYWIPPGFIQIFARHPKILDLYSARLGMQTNDDAWMVRLWTEIPAELSHSARWALYSKGGYYSPYYGDLHLAVLWDNGGKTIRAKITGEGDSESRYLRSQEFYGNPGLSWPRRTTSGISVRPLPQGAIFGEKSPTLFAEPANRLALLALMNSKPFAALVATQLAAAAAAARSYEVGIIQRTPVPKVFDKRLEELALQAWKTARQQYLSDETSHAFLAPVVDGAADLVSGFHARNLAQTGNTVTLEVLQREIDHIAFRLYGIEPEDRKIVEEMESDRSLPQISGGAEAEMDDDTGGTVNSVPEDFAAEIVSYTLGAALGRWDIRFATGEKPTPELPDPFAPLPVCPPGQLQNEQGLPITREDVARLKEESRWDYSLEIPWDGILVDDRGHPLDIEARVYQVLQIIWQDRWQAIEREVCEILGVRTLRDYFRKPAAFFADHLKRYSKSRRQAPIYWPLQTPSGSYTLWLYYHRLNDQTLYTCVNDLVEKSMLREVTEQLNTLRTKIDRSKEEEKKLDRLLDFEQELNDFRDELLRVAKFWKPNLNDGVQITAAPLWKLFQHKPWQKTLKETWERLEHGDYDWAHLAYSIRPHQVREKCRRDKSLAIAHGLEDLYIEPPAQARKKRGRTQG